VACILVTFVWRTLRLDVSSREVPFALPGWQDAGVERMLPCLKLRSSGIFLRRVKTVAS
jgi:hypothetical protein